MSPGRARRALSPLSADMARVYESGLLSSAPILLCAAGCIPLSCPRSARHCNTSACAKERWSEAGWHCCERGKLISILPLCLSDLPAMWLCVCAFVSWHCRVSMAARGGAFLSTSTSCLLTVRHFRERRAAISWGECQLRCVMRGRLHGKLSIR